ncbi:MAG TPA: GGDEF domain-containing protein [bacterium]|jgi:diguanylate cyclase (GGDEF)-like protein|nr:GGDEF domain-containing protein [bacterium]
MKKSVAFGWFGFGLGLGAPLGAFIFLWALESFSTDFQSFFQTQWQSHHFFYQYMLIGTCVFFSLFGYFVGKYVDIVRKENRVLFTETQTDPLTGLGNHRYLHEAFKNQYQNRKSDSEAISCLMMDLDFFKRVNDTYGHLFGDEVLKAFSVLIKNTIRPGDIAARFGGEEFVCILPNCKKEEAIKVAERIREVMEKNVLYFKKTPVKITVSVGVATHDGKVTQYQDLIRLADRALYQAKENGRNKVEVV